MGRTAPRGGRWRSRGRRGSPTLKWIIVGVAAMVAIGLVLLVIDGMDRPAREGDAAPEFSLANAGGGRLALLDTIREHEAVVLVFYRGFF